MDESPTCVFVGGPYPNASRWTDWEEFPEWTVCLMNDLGDEFDPILRYGSYDEACSKGDEMSREMRLELVIEADSFW